MEYKFKENQENVPADQKIIEKTGHVVEFSMVQMENDLLSFEKMLKELRGNRNVKQGVLDNVEQHHPFVKEMSEFDRSVVQMYHEAFAMKKAYEAKIAEIEKQYEEYKQEMEQIKETLPELKPIESPLAVNPEGEVEEKIISPEESNG